MKRLLFVTSFICLFSANVLAENTINHPNPPINNYDQTLTPGNPLDGSKTNSTPPANTPNPPSPAPLYPNSTNNQPQNSGNLYNNQSGGNSNNPPKSAGSSH